MSGFNHATSPTAKITAVLQDLIGSSKAIEATAIVSRDGRIIAHATRRDAEPEALFAAIEETLHPDSQNLRQLAQGSLGQIVLNAASRRVMIRQSGHNALVCTLTGGHGRGGSQVPSISGAATKLAELVPDLPPESRPAPRAEARFDPFGDIKAYGVPDCPLTAEDRSRIMAIRPFVLAVLPGVTKKLYDAMEAEPQMARFMPNGTVRLRQLHLAWLESLFTGDYGTDFVRSQLHIGQSHHLAGIPPVLLAANMAYLRAILPSALRGALGEGVLSEIAISTVMRLVDYAFTLMDTNSAGLIARVNAARRS
jgi:predicted regulator of Ras-like GTPase activity (Roadblock/LC7/MglB family)